MDFETTTCISYENLQILLKYAEQFNVALHTFIVHLIIYAAKKEKVPAKAFKNISYRKRDMNNPWKRVHLYLQYKEYEYLLDVKKIWKMSVAKAIEFCVDNVLEEFVKFLSKLVDKIDDDYTDNYLKYEINKSYLFEFDTYEGVHCCRFYWGLPLKYAKTLKPKTQKHF